MGCIERKIWFRRDRIKKWSYALPSVNIYPTSSQCVAAAETTVMNLGDEISLYGAVFFITVLPTEVKSARSAVTTAAYRNNRYISSSTSTRIVIVK